MHFALFGQVVVINEPSFHQIGRRTLQEGGDTGQPLAAQRLNYGWPARLQLGQQFIGWLVVGTPHEAAANQLQRHAIANSHIQHLGGGHISPS
jgi:hypothetical protein